MKKIECKCDKCGEFKPREFSYFTEFRMWYCDDCKPIVEANKKTPIKKRRSESKG